MFFLAGSGGGRRGGGATAGVENPSELALTGGKNAFFAHRRQGVVGPVKLTKRNRSSPSVEILSGASKTSQPLAINQIYKGKAICWVLIAQRKDH